MRGLAPIIEVRTGGEEWKRVMTHIEIRRVQNGFVVMGINAAPQLHLDERPEKCCYVCETVDSLMALVGSLTSDTGDFAWVPSVDIPITGLFPAHKGS
jgi:hypothetical protein